MIITKYLIREIFKKQIAIFFLLLLIFFCQKLLHTLGLVINGSIPIRLVLSLLILSIPKIMQLIFPLSLFLGLLLTLNRMHAEGEIVVMYACGFGKNILIRVAIMLSSITIIVATINVLWLSPWSSRYKYFLISEARTNPNILSLSEGQFKKIAKGSLVLFIGRIKGNHFEHIFLVQLKSNGNTHPFAVIADHGQVLQKSDGSQFIILDKGTRYEGTPFACNFRVINFSKYKATILYRKLHANNNNTHAEQMSLHQLWYSSLSKDIAELNWRFTLIISVLIMAIIAVPLSIINQQKDSILNIISAMLLYLIFFLVQNAIRSNGTRGEINSTLWVWMINMVYLILALLINLLDKVSVIKNFYKLMNLMKKSNV